MPSRQQNPRGYTAELSRALIAGNDLSGTVRQVNTRVPGQAPLILAILSAEQREERGLYINEHGKLAIAKTVEVAETPAAAAPVTLADTAKRLFKTCAAEPPTVRSSPSLYVVGYGKKLLPRAVQATWSKSTSMAARVAILRSAPSILNAEVSCIPHGGAYEGDNSPAATAKHAQKILTALSAPPPQQNHRIQWGARTLAEEGAYRIATTSNGVSVIRSMCLGEAVEIDAIFGDASTGQTFSSCGRAFSLTSEAVFAADPDFAAELSTSGSATLESAEASVVSEFIEESDSKILAPAYTRFIISQAISGSGLPAAQG